MKIKLKNTPDQIELVKAIGSKNKQTSAEAMEALAAFIAPVAQQVLSIAGSASAIYQDMNYNEDDSPSIPLDLFYSEKVGYATVWSQSMAGGMPYNQTAGVDELKVATYRLDSAVALPKKYARRARLDVVSKSITKMLQEVLGKQEKNGWAVALQALAQANTNSLEHLIASTTAGVFQLDDMNRLMTRIRRINTAINGATPSDLTAKGLTDLFVSPEIKEQIRGFAYQPMNTRSGAVATSGATAVPLPDSIRENIFNAAGAQEIYGVNIHELLEFGVSSAYNILFKSFYSGAVTLTVGTHQLLFGLDASREAFQRPIAQNADSGATFEVQVDDQFVSRQDKTGWYGSLEEGRVCIDARATVGLVC